MDVWRNEREFVSEWPHLQSYWLLHHAVFGNRPELEFLVKRADRRHPAVDELVGVAEEVLAGQQVTAPWWDEEKVRALR